MRELLKLLAVLAIVLGSENAMACKMLVKYPEHLEISAADLSKYYVVLVLKRIPNGYEGEIKKAFGGRLLVGSKVSIRYRTNEEAHAICPNLLKEQEIYLIRSEEFGSELTISRYNWLNVPTSHQRHAVYVRDLVAKHLASSSV